VPWMTSDRGADGWGRESVTAKRPGAEEREGEDFERAL